ncbi:MAG TPA: D-alanyl-D-alanine carboxypeptidase/D-alanyl-D-alanine-endopeptidase [Planctomycetaceae bacterium]|nr:D-alanyl-D-alanine carboxypeptidase/D-alanyl-D-alanine-endopeptidase [Planctomycetaceae bacterium]
MTLTASRWPAAHVVAAAILLSLSAGIGIAAEPLATRLEALTNAPEFKHSHWGLLVVDRQTGDELYAHNADKLFAPASVTKLFSVASALDAFGADHRFETPVYRHGDVSADGVLDGDLILVASGDLTMGGRTTAAGEIAFANSDHTYANFSDDAELTEPDPLAGLNDLARQVAAAGIRRVSGDVLIDDRLFEPTLSTGSGPEHLSPILINDSVFDVTITPTTDGEPARVTMRPESAAFRLESGIKTVAADGELETWLRIDRDRTIHVTGTIPAGRPPLVRIVEPPRPAAFARTLFIEALERAGVEVDADAARSSPAPAGLPDASEYGQLTRVATLVSPPVSESVRLILKVSHNLHASTLPLLVAAKHGKRTLEDGLRIQGEFLKRVGIDEDAVSFAGAAGGSRADYVTPRATVQLLQAMAERPDCDVYRRALPILGIDGTLAEAVPLDSAARGKVQAKTGTLIWHNMMFDRYHLTSKALAGYATTAGGRELAFAVFVNHVPVAKASDRAAIGRVLGRLCAVLCEASEQDLANAARRTEFHSVRPSDSRRGTPPEGRSGTPSYPAEAEAKWEPAIRKFEQQDRENPPPKGGVLFVGSSSIRMWDLEQSFPGRPLINRGFGGSQIADSTHFIDRLVLTHAPRTVVLYAGDNDIAQGKTPERVAADFADFCDAVHQKLPETKIVYIAIKPSRARWRLFETMSRANALMAGQCADDDRLQFVDIVEPMLGHDGQPRPELFVADGLHLSAAGYRLWASLLEPHLR